MKILTLKTKEVKESIATGLMKTLIPEGFLFKKTSNQFEKVQGDYTSIFNILITAWGNCYSIEVRLYISQKQIEHIYESIVGKSHRLTLGNTIDRIYSSPDGRKVVNGNLGIKIYFDEDIEAAVESIENYYKTIAKPYFEKYQTLSAIDDIMNNPPFEHNPADVGGNSDDRYMKGLIVARLVNNSKYEQLVATYDEAIKRTMNTESIENYYKVREYLMYNKVK